MLKIPVFVFSCADKHCYNLGSTESNNNQILYQDRKENCMDIKAATDRDMLCFIYKKRVCRFTFRQRM